MTQGHEAPERHISHRQPLSFCQHGPGSSHLEIVSSQMTSERLAPIPQGQYSHPELQAELLSAN